MSANTAAAKLAGLNQKLDQLQLKYAGLEKHVNKGGANKKKSGGAVPAEEEVTEFKAAFLTQLTEVQKHLAAVSPKKKRVLCLYLTHFPTRNTRCLQRRKRKKMF